MSLEVSFDIHGAVCSDCEAEIAIHIHCAESHEMLEAFAMQHGKHLAFRWRAKILSPPEFASDRVVELGFSEIGRLNAV